MSLMDYTSVKEVNVLQIYPIEDAKNQLKTWMETNGYGKGIIKVDSVYINDFNNNPEKYIKDDKGNWKYDELFFGTWDGGGSDLTITSTQIVEQYIKDGKGCIFGHDTIYNAHPNMWSLRNYFNIAEYSSNTFPTGNKVYISKKGLFTSYPWNIGEIGQELTIPNAHSQFTHQAKGDIWLRFSGYEENNQNFYLTTYNNCAMIQTGHSKGQATEDEQKIIANLIFYSYQSSSETSVTDNSAMDTVAPDKPSVTKNGNNYNLSSKDNGTIYKHKIEAYDLINTSTLIDTSNVTSSTVISGFKGYRYIYNNTANTKITGVNGTAITNDIIPYDSRYGYLHVAAVDNAGNVSETATVEINLHQITYKTDTIYPSDTTAAGVAGGKITRTSEIVAGNNAPLGSTATAYNCYTFDGWYSSTGELITKDATIKPLNCNAEDRGGFIYSAHFKPWTHTVAYDANGGTGVPESLQKCFLSSRWISSTIPTRTGYTFKSWNTKKDGTGTTYNPGQQYLFDQDGGTVTLYAQWTVNTYTNKLNHWARGMKYGEGNNRDKNCFLIRDTPYTKNYGETYVMDDSWLIKIPNGYYPTRTTGFFTFASNGTTNGFITRGFGYKFTQNDNNSYENLYHELYYRPYDYSITYNLNGGTNNSSNPSTYNVLYGVSLKVPTRAGYKFTGWYDENGHKVTGINEGCNATFSSADDLYAKLAARTTGNRTLTAHWSYNPISVKVPQVLTGDHTGKSQFRVKCDDMKAGSIKITAPNSFLYKQEGKTDVTAEITAKSGNNTITPTNKVCVYNITANGLSAGCWSGSFNIGLTLTKE